MKKEVKYCALVLCIVACVSDTDFSVPIISCEEQNFQATHSIAQVKEMAGYGIHTFDDEIVIEGYIGSTDEFGNIYKSISIQDKAINPTAGIRFSIDKTNLYAVFPVGRKLFIKLKGLSLGYNRGALEVAKAAGVELERIPNSEVFNHFFRSCSGLEIEPNLISINELNDGYLETLIQLSGVQFRNENLGSAYGELNSTRTIDRALDVLNSDCELSAQIPVRISGFADFKNKMLPEGNGSITGILTKYYSEYQLILRNENDVLLDKERCEIITSKTGTISYGEIVDLYIDKVVEFGVDKEFVFEGYIISSDQEGNFTNSLFIQDSIQNPTGGFRLLIDKERLFEDFKIGDKVLLQLNYLYLDKIDGVYTIGVYKNASVDAIVEEQLGRYILHTGENFQLEPQLKKLEEISVNECQNTLVTIKNVQLTAAELGKAFAYYSGGEDGNRVLETCKVVQNLELETLGTASFANKEFPRGNGEVTGVLYRKAAQLKIQLRSENDINFQNQRAFCEPIVPKILITEVADPENSTGARFIELYNAGEYAVSLNGWRLNKYLNSSAAVSGSGLDLSGLVIESNAFLIFGNTGFDEVFNMVSDLKSSYISGNGDDVYELVDRQGKVYDVYGEKGIDGSGTNWEYLDGKAVRKQDIIEPSVRFEISEWQVFTETTGNKQLAPENFTPRAR